MLTATDKKKVLSYTFHMDGHAVLFYDPNDPERRNGVRFLLTNVPPLTSHPELRYALARYGDVLRANRVTKFGATLDDQWNLTIRFGDGIHDLPSKFELHKMKVHTSPVDGCYHCRQRGHVRKDCPRLKQVDPSSRSEPAHANFSAQPATAMGVKRSFSTSENDYAGSTQKQGKNAERVEREAAQRKKFKRDKTDLKPDLSADTSDEDNEGGDTTGDLTNPVL
ncbi:hypothetical protein EDC96DRAFT_612942 [Choanephora cucurbitarum]|nr:hypothetical protein EDC96DRAFT_612942 [Choanephora cucurbitarum]